MKSLGGTMFFFGVGSIALYFLNMEFIILVWIDLWGPTPGWIIRAALIAVGGLLWIAGSAKEGSADVLPRVSSGIEMGGFVRDLLLVMLPRSSFGPVAPWLSWPKPATWGSAPPRHVHKRPAA